MKHTVVITGGAGFIGSHIADSFVARGSEVHIIDNLSSGKAEQVPSRAQLHTLDICDPECAMLLADLKPAVLVHAAAQISVRLSMANPRHDAEVNILGTLNLLQALRSVADARVVFLSTGGAMYGIQQEFPATEDHPALPLSAYGVSKRAAELYLNLWTAEWKLQSTVLRLANVYGPRQDPHGEAGVVAIFNQKLLRGETPRINGSGEQTRDFIYVGDVVQAVHAALAARASGIFNIGTGAETSVNELYREICASLKLQRTPVYGPALAGEQMRSSISSVKAGRELGWKPQLTLAAGLAQTAAWFRQAAVK